MNRRILIGAVAALSMVGLTAANAEPDSSGAGGASYGYSDGYQTGTGYSSDGYMSYGSANARVRTQNGYAGPRTSYEYRSVQPQPRGQMCLDEDGNRFACR